MKKYLVALALSLSACSKEKDEPLVCEPACQAGYSCSNSVCIAGGKTPQETVQYFIGALKGNNLEEAVKYFDLHMQARAKRELVGKNLGELARKLESAEVVADIGQDSDAYRERRIKIGDRIYPITFICNENYCKLNEL